MNRRQLLEWSLAAAGALGGLPVLGAPNGGLRARFSGLRTLRLADDQVIAGAFDWERE